jgi:glycosyltransferase involved in cell wall biosynthesis
MMQDSVGGRLRKRCCSAATRHVPGAILVPLAPFTMTDTFRLPSISFFCPAYNDEENLPRLIPRVHQFLSEITDTFEVIIVHDGSPDKTGEVADRLATEFPHVRVLHHRNNLGYGATLRDGFLAGQYDYMMYTDGDNQYDVREFAPYLHLLRTADVLSGYVTQKAASTRRKVQSLVYNVLITALFFVRCRDIDCAMKVYSRKAIASNSLRSTSCFIDAEMIIKSKRAGFKVAQFPVTHFPRTEGLASGSKFTVIAATVRDMVMFRLGLL